MSIDYSNIQETKLEDKEYEESIPVIRVIGVGGGGGNVINRMLEETMLGVDFIVANTDAMDLRKSKSPIKIALGKSLTRGLGAGMQPDIGKQAADESCRELKNCLDGTDMLFIACGMGGGTGTGAAPVIAQMAMEMGILTVAVVTTPFAFEGRKRLKLAEEGIENLKKHVDTIMVISNEKLFSIQEQKGKGRGLKLNEAFKMTDDVLKHAIGGLTGLINRTGEINLDFADVITVMTKKGKAIISTGHSNDPKNRGRDAAEKAINSPLLTHNQIGKSTGVIIHITGDSELDLKEVGEACEIIEEASQQQADVIFGVTHDESLKDEIFVTIIATGFENYHESITQQKKLSVNDTLQQYAGQENMKISQIRHNIAGIDENEQGLPEVKVDESNDLYPLSEKEEILSPENIQVIEKNAHIPEHFNNKNVRSDDYDIPAFIRRRSLD